MIRTFSIVGGMLIISTIAARVNKAYETFTEKFITIFGAFALLEAMSTNSDNWIYNSLQEIN